MSIGILIDTTLFLFIDYQDSLDMWDRCLSMTMSCQKIYNLLKPNVGRSIEEIGNLDLKP